MRAFEDELSRILLAAVYVLSAATLELGLLVDLWPGGFVVMLALMVLVRPLVVAVCSLGSDLSRRERAYIVAIAPRGVVAVALATFAGEALGEELGGPELAPLVFLTVALTIGVTVDLRRAAGAAAGGAGDTGTGRRGGHDRAPRGPAALGGRLRRRARRPRRPRAARACRPRSATPRT